QQYEDKAAESAASQEELSNIQLEVTTARSVVMVSRVAAARAGDVAEALQRLQQVVQGVPSAVLAGNRATAFSARPTHFGELQTAFEQHKQSQRVQDSMDHAKRLSVACLQEHHPSGTFVTPSDGTYRDPKTGYATQIDYFMASDGLGAVMDDARVVGGFPPRSAMESLMTAMISFKLTLSERVMFAPFDSFYQHTQLIDRALDIYADDVAVAIVAALKTIVTDCGQVLDFRSAAAPAVEEVGHASSLRRLWEQWAE
ncbi:unnamed protein product, partial [Prorocentrum cordatum]